MDWSSIISCVGGLGDRHGIPAQSRRPIANSAGNPGPANTYDEYGIPGSGNAARYQYTGQVWLNEIGLYYYKARLYSPTLGRFMQTDPIGYGDGLNWYNYVGSDPVNMIDPTGNQCFYVNTGGYQTTNSEGDIVNVNTKRWTCVSDNGSIGGTNSGGGGGRAQVKPTPPTARRWFSWPSHATVCMIGDAFETQGAYAGGIGSVLILAGFATGGTTAAAGGLIAALGTLSAGIGYGTKRLAGC